MLSIILVNYNNSSHTSNCLRLLQEQSYQNFEIIIIENNSAKKQQEELRDFLNNGELNNDFLKKTKLFYIKENLGYAGGNNMGIQNSRGDFILLLNSDTCFDSTFLEKIMIILERFKHIDIAQPKICFFPEHEIFKKKEDIIWSMGGKINPFSFRLFRMINYAKRDLSNLNKHHKIDYATGCALFIKRDVLNRVGLLDDTYFMYVEDVDLCYRAESQGFNIFCIPKIKIYHFTSKKISPYMKKYYFRNRIYFCFKNFPWYIIIWQLLIQFFALISMTMNIYDKKTDYEFFIKSLYGILKGLKLGCNIRFDQKKKNYSKQKLI